MANNEQDDNGVDYVNQTNDQTKNAGKKVANNTKKIGKTFVKLLTKLPILLPILIFIFIIIYVFALYGFLSSMPGMFIGKLKETGMSLWRGFTGFITGKFDYTDSEDVVKLAQYLQNQGYDVQGYGFGDVKYTDDSENSFTSGKTKQIEEVMDVNYRKGYLHSYIAASEETYQSAKFSVWGSIKTGGTKIVNGLKNFANMFGCHFDIIDTSIKEESTGLLNIRGIDESNINVNREGEKLELKTSTALGKRFGSMFSYDLSGWTSMYGRPTELFIALHLATGMPDLTYEIATNKDFNTKVNINTQHVTINYYTDDQMEVIPPNGRRILS